MEVNLLGINIFLWTYGAFVAVVALFGFAVQRNKERGYKIGSKIDPEDITVLIPFRNEEARLPALLESMKALKRMPKKFVFVDDHSEDNSVTLVASFMDELPIELFQLSNEKQGKKYALRAGAKYVDSKYTLTWDADVTMSPEYFSGIQSLSEADMWILPAIFTATSFWQSLFTFDVVVANAVNMGLAGWRRPIFASGANLLYRTSCFEEFDSMERHGHISSGDDTFLLQDFIKSKADVRLSSNPLVAIYTPAPRSLKEYLSQRLRWVGKTNAVGDFLNTVIAAIQLLFMMALLGLIVWSLMNGFWFGLIYLLISKCLTDFIVFSAYFKQMEQSKLLFLLPIAQIWFPLYAVLLAVLVPFYKPTWKGREVVTKT